MCTIVCKPLGTALSKESVVAIINNAVSANKDGLGIILANKTNPHYTIYKSYNKDYIAELSAFYNGSQRSIIDLMCDPNFMFYLHARISTCGSVGIINVHPFRIPKIYSSNNMSGGTILENIKHTLTYRSNPVSYAGVVENNSNIKYNEGFLMHNGGFSQVGGSPVTIDTTTYHLSDTHEMALSVLPHLLGDYSDREKMTKIFGYNRVLIVTNTTNKYPLFFGDWCSMKVGDKVIYGSNSTIADNKVIMRNGDTIKGEDLTNRLRTIIDEDIKARIAVNIN
jgi:hypothetical protein